MTKSVVLVGSSGFWFCNSLTSSDIKSCEERLDVEDVDDEDDAVVVVDVVAVDVVAAIVMAGSVPLPDEAR